MSRPARSASTICASVLSGCVASGTTNAPIFTGMSGVYRVDVDVAPVLRDEAVAELEDVAAGKRDLVTVEARVVHVEFDDHHVFVGPRIEDLVSKAGDRSDER